MRWGEKRPAERWHDPLSRTSLVTAVAAGTFARFGYWPPQFLDLVKRYHHDRIPAHVTELAARLAREQPWLVPERPPGPPMIHVGSCSWQPTVEEWEEAGR